MQIRQLRYSTGRWSGEASDGAPLQGFQLVFAFGDRAMLADGSFLEPLQRRFPGAVVVSCSSGGSIIGDVALDDGIVATAVRFESARVHVASDHIAGAHDSYEAGRRVATKLPRQDLRHVFLLSEGLAVNGSALIKGLNEALPHGVTASGGLAGDGDKFATTLVGVNAVPAPGGLVAVGLYGDVCVSTGSFGGWEPFGPDRTITRSSGNVLYELDGRPVLALYRELLGPLGYALPASGLMFPLKIRETAEKTGVVRTILGTDEAAGSVTFAGDVPQGWSARLVRTSLDQLVQAAGVAAHRAATSSASSQPPLVIAVSCIGRKLLLQQRTSEELQRVRGVIGANVTMAGFYSYGELASGGGTAPCELHNQTMTLTVISERGGELTP